MLIGQTHVKHQHPTFLKSHVNKFTSRTWKTAITAFTCCLQSCVLFSASMMCNTESCHRRFHLLAPLLLFQSRKSCVYIPSPLSQNPRHTTNTAPITASSIHRILGFVNAVLKDAAVGRFRVPIPGANATRNMRRN